MFCTELYAHEQRILWAPSFFLRLCADESRRRRRESGTEKISLPRRGDQHRHELPRDDGAPTQIEGIGGTMCSNFGSAFGDTSRAELKFFFSFERGRRWHGCCRCCWRVSNLIGSLFHYSSVSHDVCLSLLFVASLGMYFFTNLIRTDHLPSPSAATLHHIHYFVIASLAMRSSRNDRLTSPSSR